MENLKSTIYHIVGMDSEDCNRSVRNKLAAVAGVISVKIDAKKKEAKITSSDAIDMDKLEHALIDTEYYIIKQTVNNWVAAPSLRSAAHNRSASRDIEGSSSSSASTGPVTDYDKD
jgi:copper chaperone CopZ